MNDDLWNRVRGLGSDTLKHIIIYQEIDVLIEWERPVSVLEPKKQNGQPSLRSTIFQAKMLLLLIR